MPTREDVDLARGAIERGYLTIEESKRCLIIQNEHFKSGQEIPLARIFVEAKLLTEEQVNSLKESLAQAAAVRFIGHFQILSKVGAGGMGTVYRAKDTKADRVVALKVLSPWHASNREYIQRFLTEAHASGQLSHPNIVQGYDAGEANGKYYFAMEYVDGITVGDMLKDGRPVPEQQALDIAIQVAKALQHAEEHNLIHRDIKPDNVMITADGVAKLADLGLARLATPGGGEREQRSFGTPYYASPEQCEGVQELDTKTDMYSFGATLFHLLAGRVPFDDESPEEIMMKHLQEKPAYLKDRNVQLSHGVSKIVRKLMAKNKRDRYPSMADVVKDLTLVRMGRSPRLGERSRYDSGEYRYRSSTGSWRTKRPTKRKKMLQVGACVAVGLGIVLAAVIVWSLTRPGTPAPPPDRKKQVNRPQTTTPAKTADQYFLEAILRQREGSPPEEFYRKLLSVAKKYPGTESAETANEEAGAVLAAIEAEAEPAFRQRKAAAIQLRDEQKFHAAVGKLTDLEPKYSITRFPAELATLRKEVRAAADAAFRKLETEARTLAGQDKYDEAIAAYDPALKTFGIAALSTKAQAAIGKLKTARAAHAKKLAAEAAEKRRLARIANDRKMIQGVIADLREYVSKSNLGEAVAELEQLDEKLKIADHQAGVRRLIAALRDVQKLFAQIKKAQKELRNKPLKMTLKDGSKIDGTVFGVRRNGITLKIRTTIRSVTWDKFSPRNIRTLVKLARGDKFGAAEHRAFAVMFHFCGDADDVRAELDALADDPQHKEAAAQLRKDLELFTKQDDKED